MPEPVSPDAGLVKMICLQAGFSACGITAPAVLSGHRQSLEQWIQSGFHAGMDYMENHHDLREDIIKLWPETRSVVVVLHNYYPGAEENPEKPIGKVARYAWNTDYHLTIKSKLNSVGEGLKSQFPSVEFRAFTDSAPIFEREYARLAGLGWIGKNSLLLSKKGSWFNIGLLLLNIELETDRPIETNHCGSCARCMTACPTQAFTKPGQLNADRCISYQTIENKAPTLPEEFNLHQWVWGCDICQEVCPWNIRFAETSTEKEKPLWDDIQPDAIEKLSENQFRKKFWFTPMTRRGKKGLIRNIYHSNKQRGWP